MLNQDSDDHIPAIVLDKEDIKHTSFDVKTITTQDTSEKQTSKISILLVILTMTAFSVSIWFLYQQNNLLLNSQRRIETLENQLSATGEEIGTSAVFMQVKVKDLSEKTAELWKQMDKLWASAWRKNQNDIGELKANLQKYQTLQTQQQGVMKSVLSQQAQLAINYNKQTAIKTKSIQELKELLFEFEMKSADSETKISELKVKINNLSKQFKQLTEQVISFESKKNANTNINKVTQS
ncbi:hypothetical protein CJF42_05275 [Pseudoalteromonas sp. NBT06-2]|uniref:hypothetical protein n=1 Tax=Pseudoalteromonas sp. NBT06-2 TaxID=2025950 RepID=UPI000BA65DEC|nr:hypothetical protein [Pseudoalteromonas sp. NBT06-2]PAJ75383.1 hypothetical protein CJF42_05275 [Pseudoalteromonas sp. NBT06-2]